MYLSTLRRFIAALGGELEIIARFPEGVVRITQFGVVDGDAPRARGLGRSPRYAPGSAG